MSQEVTVVVLDGDLDPGRTLDTESSTTTVHALDERGRFCGLPDVVKWTCETYGCSGVAGPLEAP